MVIKARSSDLELVLSVRRIKWWISGMDWTGLVTITFCFFTDAITLVYLFDGTEHSFRICHFIMSVISSLGYILTWLCF